MKSAYINDENNHLGSWWSNLFGPNQHQMNRRAFENAPDNKVTLFRDAEYNGNALSFPSGGYVWLGRDGRDEISSVKIPTGLQLEAWVHGSPGTGFGQEVTWTQSQPYIGDLWNDRIDTIRVSKTGDAPANTNTSSDQSSQAAKGNGLEKAKKGSMLWPLAIGVVVVGLGGWMVMDSNGNPKPKNHG